jgi:hypothetical protein
VAGDRHIIHALFVQRSHLIQHVRSDEGDTQGISGMHRRSGIIGETVNERLAIHRDRALGRDHGGVHVLHPAERIGRGPTDLDDAHAPVAEHLEQIVHSARFRYVHALIPGGQDRRIGTVQVLEGVRGAQGAQIGGQGGIEAGSTGRGQGRGSGQGEGTGRAQGQDGGAHAVRWMMEQRAKKSKPCAGTHRACA